MSKVTFTPSDFREIVENFHKIADNEFSQIQILNGGSELLMSFVTTMLNTDSGGLLSKEFIDDQISKYNTDDLYRRLFSSIAMNFEVYLNTESPSQCDTTPFTYTIFTILNVNTDDVRLSESLTEEKIISSRIARREDTRGGLLGLADFWLVCVILFRLTARYSLMFDSFIQAATEAAKIPVKTPKAPKHTIDPASNQ